MPEAKVTAVFLAITSQDFPVMATNTLKRQGCHIENINGYHIIAIGVAPGRQQQPLRVHRIVYLAGFSQVFFRRKTRCAI
jgi:hypothetical protein